MNMNHPINIMLVIRTLFVSMPIRNLVVPIRRRCIRVTLMQLTVMRVTVIRVTLIQVTVKQLFTTLSSDTASLYKWDMTLRLRVWETTQRIHSPWPCSAKCQSFLRNRALLVPLGVYVYHSEVCLTLLKPNVGNQVIRKLRYMMTTNHSLYEYESLVYMNINHPINIMFGI